MEKEIISSMVASISKSEIGTKRRSNEVWKETEYGAHYEVTRHVLKTPEGNELNLVLMEITGLRKQRIKVIGEFCEVLGDPASISTVENSANCTESVLWLNEE